MAANRMNKTNLIAANVIYEMLNRSRPSLVWTKKIFNFTELEMSKEIIQKNGKSVFCHTMNVLDRLNIKNMITLFAALFHDLGKYYTQKIDLCGQKNFHGHESASMAIALRTLLEWKADIKPIDQVCAIVSTHMIDLCAQFSKQAIRNFIAKVGENNINNWFIVRRADAESYNNKNYVVYQKSIINPFYKLVQTELALSYQEKNNIELSSGHIQISGR